MACFFSAPASFMMLRKDVYILHHWFLKHGFQTCSISVTWRMGDGVSRVPLQAY